MDEPDQQPSEAGTTASWWVYLVRCADGSLYTGIALDVDRRVALHRDGRGAKYLRGRAPLELVARHEVGERALALRVERRIKRLPRGGKQALVAAAAHAAERAPGRDRGLAALVEHERGRSRDPEPPRD